MHIDLPPDLAQSIQRQIENGNYGSALEAIAAGLQLLEQQQQDDPYRGRLPDLQKDARIGWEALQRGEAVEGVAALTEIRRNLHARRHATEE